jgi:uridine kinase
VSASPRRLERAHAIARLAERICSLDLDHPARVAVDGISAAGKSTLAAELAAAIAARGRSSIHLTMDGFHHPSIRRHRRGRLSAEGYYEDAYDFAALVECVLIPLGPGGDRSYRSRTLDLGSDQPVAEQPTEAPRGAVVVVDGTFLLRPELAPHWDFRVFVNTSFAIARARGAARDAEAFGGVEPAGAALDARYHAAARIYLEAVRPLELADVIVDNDDVESPTLRAPAAHGWDGDGGAPSTSKNNSSG